MLPFSIGRSGNMLLPALAVFLAVVALFGPSSSFGFLRLWDDAHYVVENIYIRQGLRADALGIILFSPMAGNWHPLTMLSHALDVSLFGLDPGWHHQVNVLIHGLNSVLCVYLLWVLRLGAWRSFAVGLIFAVHPMQVETVAWVAERKTLLCSLFWLLACVSYVRWCQTNRRSFHVLVLVAVAMAMLAKPAAVMLPLSLLCIDWIVTREPAVAGLPVVSRVWREWFSLVLEKWPLFLWSLGLGVITLLVQQTFGYAWLTESTTRSDRFGNAIVGYVTYLARFLVPDKLHYLYPWRWLDPLSEVLPAVVLLVAITVMLFRVRKRLPVLWFGWLWFLVVPLPTMGFLQVGSQATADRYMYLPILGLGLILVETIDQIFLQLQARGLSRGIWVAPAAVLFIALAFAAVTFRYLPTWNSMDTLYNRAVMVNSEHCLARVGRARLAIDREDFVRAHQELERAKRACNLSRHREVLYESAGRLAVAEGGSNGGGKASVAGRASGTGPLEASAAAGVAVQELAERAAHSPEHAVYRRELAEALMAEKRPEAALDVYRTWTRDAPGDHEGWFKLAMSLQRAGLSGSAGAFAVAQQIRLDQER